LTPFRRRVIMERMVTTATTAPEAMALMQTA
jgi:hypothetical protein